MLTTRELAQRIEVHPATLKRWVRAGKIPPPATDRRGWYLYDDQVVKHAEAFAKKINFPAHNVPNQSAPAQTT